MRKDKPIIIIINGDKNKLSVGEKSHFSCTVAIVIVIAVLTVSLCCPDKLVEFCKMIISILK